jgi:hypothetical protein
METERKGGLAHGPRVERKKRNKEINEKNENLCSWKRVETSLKRTKRKYSKENEAAKEKSRQ